MRRRLYEFGVFFLVFYLVLSLLGGMVLAEARLHPVRVTESTGRVPFVGFSSALEVRVVRPDGVRFREVIHAGPLLARTMLRPAVEVGFLYTRLWHGLDLTQVAPDQIVRKTKVPILVIHGEADPVLPVSHSIRLVTANPNIDLWEVPYAGHCQAISVDPAEFQFRILSWFGLHSRSRDERVSFLVPPAGFH